MLNEDYEKVFVKTVLNEFINEIKILVRQNKMKIEGDKEKEVDLKLEEVIRELFFENSFNVTKYMARIMFPNNNDEIERVISTLTVYYAALYNDNVDLLKELLDKKFYFNSRRYKLNISVLDKRLSSNCSTTLVIGCLLDSDVMKTPFDEVESINIVKALEYFDEEAILNTSKSQREFIINESYMYLKDMNLNDVNRVNNFLRNTNINLALSQLIKLLPNFTDEEILKIDELFNENSRLYQDLIVKDRENNIEYFDVDRLKDILNGKDSALEEAVTKKKRFPWFRRNK